MGGLLDKSLIDQLIHGLGLEIKGLGSFFIKVTSQAFLIHTHEVLMGPEIFRQEDLDAAHLGHFLKLGGSEGANPPEDKDQDNGADNDGHEPGTGVFAHEVKQGNLPKL